MTAAGFVLFLLGACGMDSDVRAVPIAMVAAGMVLIMFGMRRLKNG